MQVAASVKPLTDAAIGATNEGVPTGLEEAAVLPGINEDIVRGSRTYHLQTEDRGERNPEVISVLFLGGAVLTTERVSYTELLEHPDRVRGVKRLMIRQHRDVLRRILEGEFDEIEIARRSMTEAEPLVLDSGSVPDLDAQAAAAVHLADADHDETVVPGSPTAHDLVAARDSAVAMTAADDEPGAAAAATADSAAEVTFDGIPELADAWGGDEEWPATGFGAEVITERPFALVVALHLQAMEDAGHLER